MDCYKKIYVETSCESENGEINYEKKRENSFFSLSLGVCVSVSNATGTVTGLPN